MAGSYRIDQHNSTAGGRIIMGCEGRTRVEAGRFIRRLCCRAEGSQQREQRREEEHLLAGSRVQGVQGIQGVQGRDWSGRRTKGR